MDSSPLRIPPAPKRHCRDLGSAAVAAVTSSSQDAIFEILSWLPAKSLRRFRCVSKEWRALVCSPSFVAAQRSRAEPLLFARSLFGRTMQLMDTEGTAVGVLEEPYVVWSFRASLGDLVCFSYGDGNAGIRVVDLATGKTLLACFESDAGRQRFYSCFGFGRAA
jgi:hypothetical protein